MKAHLLALLLLSSLQGAIQNPAEGAIEGRVLRAGSGEPLANMPVTLISTPGLSESALAALLEQISQLVTMGLQGQGGGGTQELTIRQVTSALQNAGPGVGAQASVLTDRSGHYTFANIPRGRYTVWVQRFNYFGPRLNGFLTSTNSATITFDPAKPPPPIDLFMTIGVAISGRVLNERGQPANLQTITAYRSTYNDGKQIWAPVLSRPIDDRGEYRLSPLAPGDYYVGVTPPQILLTTNGQPLSVRTFFPGVTEPAQATALTLKTSDATGVDFTLRTAPSTFYKISGTAINPAAVRAADGSIDLGFGAFALVPLESNLVDSGAPNSYVNSAPAVNRMAGEFELRNVRPGLYELYPSFLYSGFLAGRTLVDIRNADAPGIRVLVNPVVTVQGSVNLNGIRIGVKPLNAPPARGGTPPAVSVNGNGQFSVSGPAGALATLQVSALPEAAFVSDIRMGTNSVFDSGFELSASSEPLQVIIDTTTGGTVQTTTSPRATVVLVPSEDRRQNSTRYKLGTADDSGRLILRGVAPGAYTAFAWESVPETAWQNKEFLSKYQDQGTALTVVPGATVNLQLKWIPFEADPR